MCPIVIGSLRVVFIVYGRVKIMLGQELIELVIATIRKRFELVLSPVALVNGSDPTYCLSLKLLLMEFGTLLT